MERSERVLIVDDEKSLLILYRRILEEEGFHPECFGMGGEALKRVQELHSRGESLDLALLDIRLPDTTGIILMEQFRELFPGLRVIFLTGLMVETELAEHVNLSDEHVGAIQKPFTPATLYALIDEMMPATVAV